MPEGYRILVALQPGFSQSPIPEFAIKIASEISAQVDALLVQDAALMTAADLPLAQEILALTGARRSLTRAALDLDFQVLARKLERQFDRLAGRAGLRWKLRSVRGEPLEQIIAAAATSDLFMLGLPRGADFGIDTMRRIARRAGRPAVFIGDLASATGGISVFDGEPESEDQLPHAVGWLARAFPAAPVSYHRAHAGDPGDLRRRTTLVLPGRPDDESGGGPEFS